MLFDSHHLHVALGPGPQRCAGPAGPSPSQPSCLHRPTHQGCSPWSIARTQEGAASFNYVLRPPSSPRRPRGPSGRVHHAVPVPLPFAAFTTLLSPSPSSPLVSPRSIASTRQGHGPGCHFLSCIRFNHHCLHVAFGPGPPRSTGPAAPRRLHHPPVAVAPPTTGVHQGVSPRVLDKVAPSTPGPSTPPCSYNLDIGPWLPPCSELWQLPGHWNSAFTAAPLPPPGSWRWDLTATRPSAPQRLLLSSAPPYHRPASNPEELCRVFQP